MTSLILLPIMVSLFFLCDGRRIVDLTHTLDANATKWPLTSFITDPNFKYYNQWTITAQFNGEMWLSLKYSEFYEHMGTHIDAPYHFGANAQQLHEIPPERLMGPGVVIDVRKKSRETPNYGVTVDDLLEYENNYGRIPSYAIVMMNSGWAMKYPNPKLVFGTETPENDTTFNFPGFRYDACEFLLKERQVGVVGVDTPSVDPGKPTQDPYGYNLPCHMYLNPNQVPLLEYVANLDAIPDNGTTIFLGAIKTRGGTGGPTRIFAVIEDGSCTITAGAAFTVNTNLTVLGCIISFLFVQNNYASLTESTL